jgi:anti-sigma-K factor RskA
VSTPSHDHPLDDIAAYAVGALDADDRRAVEAHLGSCDACRAELAAHREALARLVPDEEPPAGLWDRIVTELPDAPDASDGPTSPDTPASPEAPGAPASPEVPGSPAGPGSPDAPGSAARPRSPDAPASPEAGATGDGAGPAFPVPGRIEIRPRALRTPDSPEGPPPAPALPTLPTPPPGTPRAPARPAPPTPPPATPAAAAPPDTSGQAPTPPTPPTPIDGRRSPRPRHLAGRPRRQRAALLLAAAAAAVLLVVASVAATLALSGDGDGGGDTDGGGTGGGEVAADVGQRAEQAAADPTSIAQLASAAGAPAARLVTSELGSYVLFDDLPALAAGRTYQLWSLDAAAPVSLGVLGDGSEEAVAVALPPATVHVAISDAPAGGEPAPTGPIVATGEVRAP